MLPIVLWPFVGLFASALLLAAIVVVLLAIAAWRRQALGRRLAPPGRAMGKVEQMFDEMHQLGALVVCVAARVEGAISQATLRRAADAVAARHPLLRVHVLRDDGLFRSDGTLPIPVREVMTTADDDWEKVFAQELATPIPYGRTPLVRLSWVHKDEISGTLVITCNHAVCDGVSAVVLVRDLLLECGREGEVRAAGADPGPLASAPAMSVPPIDDGLRGRTFPPPPKQRKAALLPVPSPTKPHERLPGVHFVRVGPEIMSPLLRECRKQETTFHGVLSAAALLALAAKFGTPRDLSLASNVNIRRELAPPPSDDTVGCFIWTVTSDHAVKPSASLWETAREVRASVVKLMEQQDHLRGLVGDFTWLHRLGLRHWVVNANDGRFNSLNVSNSGRFDIERTFGPLRLAALFGTSSQHILGSTLQLTVVSLGSELFAAFSWAVPLLSSVDALALGATVVDVLHRASRGETVTMNHLAAPTTAPAPPRVAD